MIIIEIHGEEHKRRGVGLLVPIESIIAGELELKEGVIHTKDDIAHHKHKGAIQTDEGSDMRKFAERIEKGQRGEKDCKFSDDDSCSE